MIGGLFTSFLGILHAIDVSSLFCSYTNPTLRKTVQPIDSFQIPESVPPDSSDPEHVS
jgi:hypothetical protein